MEYYALTHFQNLILEMLKNNNVNAVNLSCIVFFEGKLDTGRLKEAINNVVMKNDGLMIRLTKKGDEIIQYVPAFEKKDIEVINFTGFRDFSFIDEWLQREDKKSMKLFDCDLFEFKILELNESTACFIKLNHLTSDGWSFNLIRRELEEEYDALVENKAEAAGDRPSVVKYIKKQLEYVNSDKMHKNILYWMDKSRPPVGATCLKPEALTGGGFLSGCTEFDVSEALYKKLEKFCAVQSTSILIFYLSVMAVYLAKANSINDTMLGTYFHNRMTLEEQRTIGCFAAMLPIRTRIDMETDFSYFLKQIADELKTGMRNNYFSLKLICEAVKDKIMKHSGPIPDDMPIPDEIKEAIIKQNFMQNDACDSGDKSGDESGLFLRLHAVNTIVSFENWYSSGKIKYAKKDNVFYQLSLRIRPVDNERLVFEYLYLQDSFNEREIGSIHRSILNVTEDILDNPEKRLSELAFY